MESSDHHIPTKTLFVLFIAFFLCILFFGIKNIDPKHFEHKTLPISEKLLKQKEKFYDCINVGAKLYYFQTYQFFQDMDVCIELYLGTDYEKFEYFPNGANGERKVFLPMTEEFKDEECRWLTIGVGGLIGVEEMIKKKYPNCKIYGVEPGNNGNFTKVGELLQAGVGLKDGTIKIRDKDTKVIALPKLLDEFVHSRLVHYLSIDIESYEMVILRELVGKKGKFANENITFCQIDIELHNPRQGGQHPDAVNINRVQWMLDFVDSTSPYIPVFTVPYTPAQKVTFVNIVEEECERAFNITSYLS